MLLKNSLRSKIPEMAIRTSVMVGFPGETEEDVTEMIEFLEDMKFDHLGCFTYSQEEGTVAGRMKNQIDEDIKVERQGRVMEAQKKLSNSNLQKFVGQKIPVLVKGVSEESDLLFEGRISIQAPEVDGVVYINDGQVKPGSIQMVEITEAHDYDLVGHIVEA